MSILSYPQHVAAALEEWETIAFVAFEGFSRHGRGIVAIDVARGDGGDTLLEYVVYPEVQEAGTGLDPAVRTILDQYDPDEEMIVQFVDSSGTVRTFRVRTSPGASPPRRVWFFEMLRRVVECPEDVELPLPEWFEKALDDLAKAQKE